MTCSREQRPSNDLRISSLHLELLDSWKIQWKARKNVIVGYERVNDSRGDIGDMDSWNFLSSSLLVADLINEQVHRVDEDDVVIFGMEMKRK